MGHYTRPLNCWFTKDRQAPWPTANHLWWTIRFNRHWMYTNCMLTRPQYSTFRRKLSLTLKNSIVSVENETLHNSWASLRQAAVKTDEERRWQQRRQHSCQHCSCCQWCSSSCCSCNCCFNCCRCCISCNVVFREPVNI